MKELDLLLEGWVRCEFDRASAAERARFASLLELTDPDLIAYLLGGVHPQDPDLAAAIRAVLAPGPPRAEPSTAPPL